MKLLRFAGLYTENGWIEPAYIQLDSKGIIENISNKPLGRDLETTYILGYGIPGFQNAHSHSFQYAMAGITERLPDNAKTDNFWTWREVMYHLALSLTPDDIEIIATCLYAEMLKLGYTSVAEFHYLHHDNRGKPYDNLAETGIRLMNAAKHVGIHLTLLPVLYQMGDFNTPYYPNQCRFISHTLEDFYKLLADTKANAHHYKNVNVGLGIHSLRAVSPETVVHLLESFQEQCPIHMHVSEQTAEVLHCQKATGLSPVAWLLKNIHLDKRFNLIHAIHATTEELSTLANTGVNIVFCPSTEGNLGDGIGNLVEFIQSGGHWCIGSDSQIGQSPLEELRWLDYIQRLMHQRRNVLCIEPGNSGEVIFQETYCSGSRAMGNWDAGIFKKGSYFDCVVIDAKHPLISSSSSINRLSTLIYACSSNALMGTMVHGRWVVKGGVHPDQENIYRRFKQCLKKLQIR